ncbi:calmodulin, putative [Trypanosoma brucei gambiense DAL972]|uniref:Calmodulin, putative n=3 Tax=Trypanosoma brucei TaxID=5691 RepID=C9ZRE5_TRYB9|nr:calmodulin, putative [Trypanosoma brucei gambiense DAL972]CBH11975.1 calmodulin, putative [Trypanosoma brucei gambiense DAL972]|eukprot:XP_011774260.1 calmodulin, putative [Trypanosoma brucei gambiense DAL972]
MTHVGAAHSLPPQFDSLSPEEVDMLRDSFIYMDRDNDGHVSKAELLDMVFRCVGEERYGPLVSYLLPLFDVADKDGDGKLSLAEFVMSFVDGPGVVPAEVINSCVSSIRVRLTDEEIVTLQDSFRRIDTKADGYIDREELLAALKENLKDTFPDLRENNFNDIVAVIMASADVDNDGRLCLSEFIRSFQEDQGVLPAVFVDARSNGFVQHLSPAEVEVLREAFATLDKNHDGYVEFADIYESLWEAVSDENYDKNQIYELCDLIMVTTDRSKSGVLTLGDFVRGFIRNVTLVQLPVATAHEEILRCCERVQLLFENGELERLSGYTETGENTTKCVNPGGLVSVLSNVFRDGFPLLEEEILSSVIGALVAASENDLDKKFGIEEFISCFAGGPCSSSDGVGLLDHENAISESDVQTVSRLLRDLGKSADEGGNVQEPFVLEAVRNTFRDDPEKADRVVQYVQYNTTCPSNLGSGVGGLGSSSKLLSSKEDSASLPTKKFSGPVRGVDAAVQCEQVSETQGEPEEEEEELRVAEPLTEKGVGGTSLGLRDLLKTSSGANVGAKTGRLLTSRPVYRSMRISEWAANQRSGLNLSDATMEGKQKGFDSKLRKEFEKFAEGNDYIERSRFVKLYLSMEHFGLPPSEAQVNELVSRYCRGDKLKFNEFCIIMLRRVGM